MSVEVALVTGAGALFALVALVTIACYYCYTLGVGRGRLEKQVEYQALKLEQIDTALEASERARGDFDAKAIAADTATLDDHVGLLWGSETDPGHQAPDTSDPPA